MTIHARRLLMLLLVVFTPLDCRADSPITIYSSHAKRLFEDRANFVDARSKNEFEREHIPSAVNLPPEEFSTAESLRLKIAVDVPIVFYDDGDASQEAEASADRAIDLGFKNVMLYSLGFSDWKSLDFPIE
jgi:rhodanese-related sulfurtransferase